MKKGRSNYGKDCFSVNGQDLYIYSGEIHYFRVPRELWEDRLLKAKRCLLNAIGAYVAWNWHEQTEGKLDFTGDRDLDFFFDLCKDLGLYIIIRPGPYICAEWDSGGFPRWLWAKDMAFRSLDPKFMEYTERWYDTICPISKRHLITQGGTGILFQIENEYFWGNVPYILKLSEKVKERGIDVPIIHNVDRYIRGTDVIDSLDFYPDPWKIEDFEKQIDLLREEQPDKPSMIMELEGGWFSVFGGSLPTSRGHFPAEWTDVLVKTSVAKGVNAINFYMFHGGTNFDYWTAKDITTTYDYEAAIREWGELGERYWVIRLIGGFLRSFSEALLHSKPVEGFVKTSNKNVDIFCRKGDREAFLFIRNMGDQDESVRIKSSLIPCDEVPVRGSIVVTPRSMIMLPLNYMLEKRESSVLYSTSQVFLIEEMKDRTVIIVYGRKQTPGEISFELEEAPKVSGNIEYEWDDQKKILRFNYVHSDSERIASIRLRRNIELVVTSDDRAARTWLPSFRGENTPIISNIYFLRGWDSKDGSFSLFTELTPKELIKVSAIFPRKVKNVRVNGDSVDFNYDEDASILSFSFNTKEPPNLLQRLNGTWRMKIESPEKEINFDDSEWNRWIPGTALEAMGFVRNGYSWYRCRFKAPEDARNAIMSMTDVKDYAAVFLNGRFIVRGRNRVSADAGNMLVKGGENVLAVCVESIGHSNGPCMTKDPNGILSPVYFSLEERIELRDWKFKIGALEMEMKLGLPASADISMFLNSEEAPHEALPNTADEEWEKMTVPLAKEISEGSLTELQRVKATWLRTWIDIPKRFEGKSVLLSLKDLMPGMCKIYVNGVMKGSSSTWGPRKPEEAVEVDISDCVKFGETNLVAVVLSSARALHSFPELVIFGHKIHGEWEVEEELYGQRNNWAAPELNDSEWKEVQIPSSWKDQCLEREGIVWYRKRFGFKRDRRYVAPLKLTLSEVKSRCLIFLNGRLIGRYADVGPQKDFYLPEPWLKEENVLALAVENFDGNGGITGEVVVSPYCLSEIGNIQIQVE